MVPFYLQTLWLERTSLRCCTGFPGILRWFEVVETSVEEVQPVSHACEVIETKNREIQQLVSEPSEQPIQRLSLSLQV